MLAACDNNLFFEAVRNNLGDQDSHARKLALATEAIADSTLLKSIVSKYPKLEDANKTIGSLENELEQLKLQNGGVKKREKCSAKLNTAIQDRINANRLRAQYTACKQREAELITEVYTVAHTLTMNGKAVAAHPKDTLHVNRLEELARKAVAIEEELGDRWARQNLDDLVRRYTEYSTNMRQDLVATKYFIAGGSARWMFGFSEEGAMDEVQLWVHKFLTMTIYSLVRLVIRFL